MRSDIFLFPWGAKFLNTSLPLIPPVRQPLLTITAFRLVFLTSDPVSGGPYTTSRPDRCTRTRPAPAACRPCRRRHRHRRPRGPAPVTSRSSASPPAPAACTTRNGGVPPVTSIRLRTSPSLPHPPPLLPGEPNWVVYGSTSVHVCVCVCVQFPPNGIFVQFYIGSKFFIENFFIGHANN